MAWTLRTIPSSYIPGNVWVKGGKWLVHRYATSTVYASDDLVTYSSVGVMPTPPVGGSSPSQAVNDGARWYVALSGGFARSTDGLTGQTWELVGGTNLYPGSGGADVPGGYLLGITSTGRLIVSGADGHVATSDDGGSTWTYRTTLPLFGVGASSKSKVVDYAGTIILACNVADIYVSTDNGVTWVSKSPGLGSAVSSVVMFGGLIAVTAGTTVPVASSDGGDTWAPTSIDSGAWLFAVGNGFLFRYKTFPKVMDYTDDLVTWTPIDVSSIGFTQMNDLRIDDGMLVVRGSVADAGLYTEVAPVPLAVLADCLETLEASVPQLAIGEYFASVTFGSVAASLISSSQVVIAACLSSAGAAGSITTLSMIVADARAATAAGVALGVGLELEAAIMASIKGAFLIPIAGEATAAWCINAETNGSTRYENFDFNSFTKIGDSYYGCKADGIYKLDGDTDADAPIQAMVSFGKQDFGTTMLKRVTNIYLGASSTGKLFVKVLAEGEEYLYEARDSSEHIQSQRVDLGRGLRANYLEFELYNADGDDFELASVEFAAVPLTRRI
jgi:hypothetical protein